MVRTRFAPSPTGYLNIGGARTALFNYIFSKKHGGSFILRIEDTDKERSKKEYEDDILGALAWLGIHWDEGPDSKGAYGPYRQSERRALYRKYLLTLHEADLLYPCFCTTEELEKERELQTLAKQPTRYGGTCSTLTDAEQKAREAAGKKSTLRFRVPKKFIRVSDLIRGEMEFDTSLLDDFIVAKDFDTALYNFAVVIDDALMGITHVLRGEEHLSNVPKQVLIAESLGLIVPQFAHLPLILSADRKKLSKRENKTSLIEDRAEGYLPEALVNFMALLGWNPGGDKEIFTLEEMKKSFDINDIHKGGAVFDTQKLQWLNGMYIRKKDIKELTDLCVPYLKEAGYISEEGSGEDKHYRIVSTGEVLTGDSLEKIIHGEQDRLKTLRDIISFAGYFFSKELVYERELISWKDMPLGETAQSLVYAREIFENISDSEYTPQHIETAIKQMIAARKLTNGAVLWPLRVALTGLRASQGPFDVAALLGKEKTILRIRVAEEKLRDS